MHSSKEWGVEVPSGVSDDRWQATAVSATLQAFLSTQDSVALPKLLKQYKASPKYQYQASMLTMVSPCLDQSQWGHVPAILPRGL